MREVIPRSFLITSSRPQMSRIVAARPASPVVTAPASPMAPNDFVG
jgi:hypothetical protein